MIPILFEYDAMTNDVFKLINNNWVVSHGIGDLVDCLECKAQVNDEGEYELSFSYPVSGALFKELTINRIVVAKVEAYRNATPYQMFRIYGYEKNLNGTITIKCQHISYDLSGILVHPEWDTSVTPMDVSPIKDYTYCKQAMIALTTHATPRTNSSGKTWDFLVTYQQGGTTVYHMDTDIPSNSDHLPKTDTGKFSIDTPISIRSMLLDGDTSIKGVWGGDLIFDNYYVKLNQTGGADVGVTLEYGVDITDLSLEEDISEIPTHVYPYVKTRVNNPTTGEDIDRLYYTDITEVPDYSTSNPHQRNMKVIPLDLSEYWIDESSNTASKAYEYNEKLLMGGSWYVVVNNGNPIPAGGALQVGTTIRAADNQEVKDVIVAKAQEWMQAENTGVPEFTTSVGYANIGQDIHMHDAIAVNFPKMGIKVKSKVTSYTYDVLAEKCTNIEVSSVKHRSKWKGLEDASRLKHGLIPPQRIGTHSIQSTQISTGAVTGRSLGTGSVSTPKLGNGSVSTPKLGDESVTNPKVENGNQAGTTGLTASKLVESLRKEISEAVNTKSLVTGTLQFQEGKGNILFPTHVVTSGLWVGSQGTACGVSWGYLYADVNGQQWPVGIISEGVFQAHQVLIRNPQGHLAPVFQQASSSSSEDNTEEDGE